MRSAFYADSLAVSMETLHDAPVTQSNSTASGSLGIRGTLATLHFDQRLLPLPVVPVRIR